MTLDDLQKHPAFVGLSDQQKDFTLLVCRGTDKVRAAQQAWQCKDDRSARAMANAALRKSKVGWLIEQFQGTKHIPTRDEVAGQCWEWAMSPTTESAERAKFVKLAVDILGYAVKALEAPAATPVEDGDEPFQL